MDDTVIETRDLDLSWYAGSTGFDPGFLGHNVPLPSLPAELLADQAPLLDGSGYELKYLHFSLVLSKSRHLALFTGVNVDGKDIQDLKRDRDVWYFDPRISRQYQMGPEIYKHRDIDRGHLVRRLDPVWGPDAKAANEDTFHFTNCSPQHSFLNEQTWRGLEDYILSNAKVNDLKLCVFTGPVLRPDDPVYLGKYAIPEEFWKVVAMVKTDGTLWATAYIESQRDLIARDVLAAPKEFEYGEYQTYQVPVGQVEKLTSLTFGTLSECDPLVQATARELETPAVRIEGPADLVL